MSTLTATSLTLLDHAKRLDPNGSSAVIAELLSLENEILTDMPFIEGNLPTGHRTTVRTGLPDVAWRKLNKGVPASKSTTAQIDEACGMLEGFSTVDKDLAELNGNTASFRMSENAAFIESLNQSMASTLFYGDTAVNPERFLGLAPRYSSLSAANGDNIINAAGSSARTSVWLVGWGQNTVHGIFPKGSRAGLVHEDLGLDTVLDADNNAYRAYQDRYQWKIGMALRDWRYVVRIANIDSSALVNTAATGTDLVLQMTKALERVKSLSGVTPVFYVNRTVRTFLRLQIVYAVKNSTLAMDTVAGKRVMSFSEVPVRLCDSITNAESAVA